VGGFPLDQVDHTHLDINRIFHLGHKVELHRKKIPVNSDGSFCQIHILHHVQTIVDQGFCDLYSVTHLQEGADTIDLGSLGSPKTPDVPVLEVVICIFPDQDFDPLKTFVQKIPVLTFKLWQDQKIINRKNHLIPTFLYATMTLLNLASTTFS
jgi:hypothetical protein